MRKRIVNRQNHEACTFNGGFADLHSGNINSVLGKERSDKSDNAGAIYMRANQNSGVRINVDAEIIYRNDSPFVAEKSSRDDISIGGDRHEISEVAGNVRFNFGKVNSALRRQNICVDEIDVGIKRGSQHTFQDGG